MRKFIGIARDIYHGFNQSQEEQIESILEAVGKGIELARKNEKIVCDMVCDGINSHLVFAKEEFTHDEALEWMKGRLSDGLSFKYTVCFIKHGNDVLMLNRNYPPVMGLWNGVGGTIEKGETPKENIMKEVFEETGITLGAVVDKGAITWNIDGESGGMHLFVVELPVSATMARPKLITTDEGTLEWKELSWITNPKNLGVPIHVAKTLEHVFRIPLRYEYRSVINNGKLESFKMSPIEVMSIIE